MEQQNQSETNTKLNRIAWLSKRDEGKKFQCLMHLFNPESLTECFHELDKNKAVGIDGVTKTDYEQNLEKNIQELIAKMKAMAYRPGPVREVLIPKEGKHGATRPLGISNLEDKIVQKMMHKVLESIYEPIFLEGSHGFRPERSCHTAIQTLQDHLYKNNIQTVIDIDLKNFFGTIDHKILEAILGLVHFLEDIFRSIHKYQKTLKSSKISCLNRKLLNYDFRKRNWQDSDRRDFSTDSTALSGT